MEDIAVIPFHEGARAFVLDSFVTSLLHTRSDEACDWRARAMDGGAMRAWLRGQLEHVRLAVPANRPDVLVGWSLVIGNTLHYVYVKHAARRFGIARGLLADTDVKHVSLTTWPWTAEYAKKRGWA